MSIETIALKDEYGTTLVQFTFDNTKVRPVDVTLKAIELYNMCYNTIDYSDKKQVDN